MQAVRTVIWKRLDIPGMEHFQCIATPSGWRLKGMVVLAHPGSAAGLTYSIDTDNAWHTREVFVQCTDGRADCVVAARADAQGHWWHHDNAIPVIDGCVDVDLGFSPSTNTLPIRRLRLAVGESAEVKAAWLRFPELRWELLLQTYRRTAPHTYEYQSPGFRTIVDVDDLGVVKCYRGYWEAVQGE